MNKYLIFIVAAGWLCISVAPPKMTPLQKLLEGNARYVQNTLEHPNRSLERREEVTSGQEPFAIIIACADSRVGPEIIFDQGIGDLFVVRVAGNVIGPLELESIQYAALNLHSSVILVLGHERCGAVDAVLKNTTSNIEEIAALIEPAVAKVKASKPANLLAAATKANAINMKNALLTNSLLQPLLTNKALTIYAGYYNLQTGAVEILDTSSP